MKKLDDFLLEIAHKYEYPDWEQLLEDAPQWIDSDNCLNEAIELYAEYRAKESWNEALKWAVENAQISEGFRNRGYGIVEESILKGIK